MSIQLGKAHGLISAASGQLMGEGFVQTYVLRSESGESVRAIEDVGNIRPICNFFPFDIQDGALLIFDHAEISHHRGTLVVVGVSTP